MRLDNLETSPLNRMKSNGSLDWCAAGWRVGEGGGDGWWVGWCAGGWSDGGFRADETW